MSVLFLTRPLSFSVHVGTDAIHPSHFILRIQVSVATRIMTVIRSMQARSHEPGADRGGKRLKPWSFNT